MDTSSRIAEYRHETALGAWRIALCRPQPALADLVAALWYGEGRVRYARDRILPAAQSYLLINLGPPQYRIDGDGRRVPFRDVWFCGLHQSPIDTEAPHGNALLGVAFHAGGAWPWLGIDQDAFADRTLPLADACGAEVPALRQRLLETSDLAVRFALVEGWLLARRARARAGHPALAWAIGRIAASAGRIDVATLARETGYSRQHLTGLFLRQAGLAPKALARVHRFRRALTLFDGAARVPWAELAAACGYYDQSHLIRDFRAFTGFSPGEFLARARPDGLSVVVD